MDRLFLQAAFVSGGVLGINLGPDLDGRSEHRFERGQPVAGGDDAALRSHIRSAAHWMPRESSST